MVTCFKVQTLEPFVVHWLRGTWRRRAPFFFEPNLTFFSISLYGGGSPSGSDGHDKRLENTHFTGGRPPGAPALQAQGDEFKNYFARVISWELNYHQYLHPTHPWNQISFTHSTPANRNSCSRCSESHHKTAENSRFPTQTKAGTQARPSIATAAQSIRRLRHLIFESIMMTPCWSPGSLSNSWPRAIFHAEACPRGP